MRRIVATIMLSLSLGWAAVPGLDLHELRSVGTLIRHYVIHRDASDMSVADFLAAHYGAQAAHEATADPSDHADLPLKGHGCTPGATVLVEPAEDLPRPLEVPVSGTPSDVTEHPTLLPGPTPFQPPRP
jgi:hypothetical protein